MSSNLGEVEIVQGGPSGLTMSVKEYCRLAGVGEIAVRREIAKNTIPHRKYGKRGLIRILRVPALAQLYGASVAGSQHVEEPRA